MTLRHFHAKVAIADNAVCLAVLDAQTFSSDDKKRYLGLQHALHP